MDRKRIILAGGTGSRLFPLTSSISKQLLPVFDKPMIFYPLTTLMIAGIKEILLITAPKDQENFKKLLGHGERWGIEIQYAVQEAPDGIAQAVIIGEQFIGKGDVALILGDNIFYSQGLGEMLSEKSIKKQGATIFAHFVKDPKAYGVVSIDERGQPKEIIEKPKNPLSNWAVTGLYFYDNQVIEIAKSLKPSARGELEITDVNLEYLANDALSVKILSRGTAWLDAGQPKHLLEAANFVKIVEERQGLKIACPEEIAFRMGFIGAEHLLKQIRGMPRSSYRDYLKEFISRETK